MILTREQIEIMHRNFCMWITQDRKDIDAFRDMALRALPAGEGAPRYVGGFCQDRELCVTRNAELKALKASPAPVAAEAVADDEMPLEYEAILAEFNEWCKNLSYAPEAFEAFEAAAHRYAATSPAPADESPVDSQTSEGRGK